MCYEDVASFHILLSNEFDCVKSKDVSASKLFDRFLCALRDRLYIDPALRARTPIIHHSYSGPSRSLSTPQCVTRNHNNFHPRHITTFFQIKEHSSPSSVSTFQISRTPHHILKKTESTKTTSTPINKLGPRFNCNMSAEPEHVESKAKVKANLK